MDEITKERTGDRHSVNCYSCGEEGDEREWQRADPYNHGDGGSMCDVCLDKWVLENNNEENRLKLTQAVVDSWDMDTLIGFAMTRLAIDYEDDDEFLEDWRLMFE